MNEETDKPKEKPDFFVFQKDQEGNSKLVGSAFNHKKGKGLNILVGKDRFTAFPPKMKP